MKRNIAYFYRVLGKHRLQLLRDILQKKPEIIEPTLRALLRVVRGPSEQLKGHPSLATMYAYASYLVDTFGGQSDPCGGIPAPGCASCKPPTPVVLSRRQKPKKPSRYRHLAAYCSHGEGHARPEGVGLPEAGTLLT